jgi:protein-S-isoprenylcysteine O-methyltransferase Ste14
MIDPALDEQRKRQSPEFAHRPYGGCQRHIQNFITGSAAGLALCGVFLQFKPLLEGKWWQIGTLFFYTMVFCLFLLRRPSRESSKSIGHWVFALSGTFLPFLTQFESHQSLTLFWAGVPLQIAGMALSVVALSYLGRSFGVVAAHREIQSQGPYRIVRHPLYLGEALWFFSIILQNISWFNLGLFCIQLGCQIRRIKEEEMVLGREPKYGEYVKSVSYRLVPEVF